MNDDLISRQAAIDVILPYCPDDDGTCSKSGDDLRNLLDDIENLPSAQTERKEGKWIDNKGLYQCSVCKHIWSELWWVESCPIDRMNKIMHYCPNCGAEMEAYDD